MIRSGLSEWNVLDYRSFCLTCTPQVADILFEYQVKMTKARHGKQMRWHATRSRKYRNLLELERISRQDLFWQVHLFLSWRLQCKEQHLDGATTFADQIHLQRGHT